MADKYTWDDIIINPNDPRLEGAIGKEVYTANSPFICVRKANRSGDYKELTRIDSDLPCPFITQNSSWNCIILKKEPTYDERQAEWIKENDIKIGDKVKVVSLWTDEDAAREKCIPRHDVPSDIVGSVCKIDKITRLGLRVDFGEYMWYCPYFVLEKIVEPEKKYVPFDLSDPEVRKSLRGRWVVEKNSNPQEPVEGLIVGFESFRGYWVQISQRNAIQANELLKCWVFDDGTPCGKEVEE